MSKLWGGRFGGEQDPFFEAFNQSLSFDRRLLFQDIFGSMAWARALAGAGILSDGEAATLVEALQTMARELSEGNEALLVSDAEDIHSFVEGELGNRVGELARKLHTGRSRNDQVATDLKLWLRGALEQFDEELVSLMQTLAELAQEHASLPIPGYTHLQRAQPVTVGHHALAYVEMLSRDRSRLRDTGRRMDTCPLGSGALAGTAFDIDREELAEQLGFASGPTGNSLDAVSDRDHVLEAVFGFSMVMQHLSRLAEDWIFFASSEAGFLQLSDKVATGSSLMPQKKNPDSLELIRGKTGRVMGDLQGLLVTLKGLPLAYNKDMQEDKEALFDAFDNTLACVKVAATTVQSATFNAERCQQACSHGFLNATDLADLLVAEGVPFRDAHERVGIVVRKAVEHGCEIEQLPEAVRSEFLPELPQDLTEALSVQAVLARRKVIGGTAPERVREAAAGWLEHLGPVNESDD